MQRDRYNWGREIESYAPKVVDTVGVVSVHIGLDGGPSEDVFFQLSLEALDLLERQFAAARKDLLALQQFLGIASEAR